jgi:hypothetical protein
MIAVMALTRRGNILENFRPRRVGLSLLVSVLFSCVGIVIVVAWPLAVIRGIDLRALLAEFGLEGVSLFVFLAYLAFANPFVEEAFWRFGSDDHPLSFVNDLFYAGYHGIILALVLTPIFVIGAVAVLVAAGAIFRLMTVKLKNGFMAIATHLAADLGIGLAVIVLGVIGRAS